jgi:REP element-mobilizing transposase RayT
MNRGVAKRDVFVKPDDGLQFLALSAEAASLVDAECHAYCLMPNHYHLLVHTPRGGLSQMMWRLGARYTQRFNQQHERDGPLFRGRYKAVLIDADDYLLQVSRYIHRNPVSAGLIDGAEHYRWSSYRNYLAPSTAPDWLHYALLTDMAGGPDAYRDYVETGTDRETENFFARPTRPSVLGSKSFRNQLRAGHRDETPAASAIDTVLRLVAKDYGIDQSDLTRDHRGRNGEARAVAMFLCRRNHRGTDIAEALDCSTPAVSKAVARIRRHLDKDAKLAKRVARLETAPAKSQ